MRKRFLIWLTLPLMLVLFGFGSAESYTNFGIGFSVGNYDYLPYGHSSVGVSLNFNNYMNDYGNWVDVPRFGRCWRPYATSGWRPYLYGHWDYTSYGPTWEGYEPWAWVGYHYGNWIWTQEFGWVWIPGYDYSPGRVVWGYDSNAIGWMPAPPVGYSYGCGYLSYGDCGYSDPFYSPGFSNISFNLFVFIDRHRWFNDNYGDYYLGRDYARNVFVRRSLRFDRRPIQRTELERIVGRRVTEVPVQVKQVRMGDRVVRAVLPEGSDARLRRNADRVIKQVIAPAIKERRDRNFETNGRGQFDRRENDRSVERRSDRDFNRNQFDRNQSDRGRDFTRGRSDRDLQFEDRNRGRNDQSREVIRNDRGNRNREFENRSRESDSRIRNFGEQEREQRLEERDRRLELQQSRNNRDRERDFQARERVQQESQRRDTERRDFERRDLQRRDMEQRDFQRRDIERGYERPEPPQQRIERNDRSPRDFQSRNENSENSKKSQKKPKKVKD